MTSKLDSLRTLSVIVADTGDLEAIRALRPVDCTTNPSLVRKVASQPGMENVVAAALAWGREKAAEPAEQARLAAIRLGVLVVQLATTLVPGRVSVEVDARLSTDMAGSIGQAHNILTQLATLGITRDRVLIKIAGTWEGIQATRALQADGIDCNVTLIFSLAQATASADAGAFLISPFVGRISDWVAAHGGSATDIGVDFVKAVFNTLKARGSATIVMAASFRSIAQIEALAGCDRLTISPALLMAMDNEAGTVARALVSPPHSETPVAMSEAAFRSAMAVDQMATDLLTAGIAGFVADTNALEAQFVGKISAI